MNIRRIDNNTFDIFQGKGWNNWTRIRKGRSSTYGVLGKRISHALMKDLNEVLHARLPVNYAQSLETTLAMNHAINTR